MFGFGKDHWAQSKQLFEEQFERDGDAYLYRRSQKGAPVRVTAVERERYLAEYASRLRIATWIIYLGLMLVAAVVVWWTVEANADFPDLPIYLAIGAVAAISIGFAHWAWGAPARELVRRTPVGSARSAVELRRIGFQRLSYGQLAGTAFVGAILPFTLRGDQDVFTGWGRLWLVFGGVIVLIAAVQAFRKRRFDRLHEDA